MAAKMMEVEIDRKELIREVAGAVGYIKRKIESGNTEMQLNARWIGIILRRNDIQATEQEIKTIMPEAS